MNLDFITAVIPNNSGSLATEEAPLNRTVMRVEIIPLVTLVR